MTVLMFGWEFPPHISGGLGTACYGLTKALAKEGLNILFVVPKAYGNEPAKHLKLINASAVEIPLPEKKTLLKKTQKKSLLSKKQTIRKVTVTRSAKEMTVIEVESAVMPYTSPMLSEQRWSVEQWNYQFTEAQAETVATEKKKKRPAKKYSFSGTYGFNLMSEVDQLREVAHTLALDFSFDVIHAHDWMTYPAGIAAKKISRKPLVVHVHATEFDRSGGHYNPEIYAIEKSGLEEADRIVTVSQWTKNVVTSKYNIAPEKVEVVYNGVVPTIKENGMSLPPVGSHIVTFLGRVTHQKGPSYFVEAARKVLRVMPDTHFVVAGSGDLLPQMIERVADLKLSKRFHFTGFLNTELISRIWSMTNVYVMPSVSEPFGLTPLEAIQSHIPVIISKQSGVAEVMPHAIKVDFWDTDALADSIASVLRFKSLSETLKKNSAGVIRNLTWENSARKIKELYYALPSS